MGARREVVWAVAERYGVAGRREKGRILDELTATTGWHRKHAVRGKARILLKADISAAGEGWSDSRIIEALDTSAAMIYRVRKQLVEEGFEAVLSRKPRMTPPVAAIFDGEKEAKLIALACSKPPKAFDTADFVADMRALNVTPHVAQNTSGRRSAIDSRTTRHAGYEISQQERKRVEEPFGWGKTIGGLARPMLRGVKNSTSNSSSPWPPTTSSSWRN